MMSVLIRPAFPIGLGCFMWKPISHGKLELLTHRILRACLLPQYALWSTRLWYAYSHYVIFIYRPSAASTYFYLPIDEDEDDDDLPPHSKHIDWQPSKDLLEEGSDFTFSSSSSSSSSLSSPPVTRPSSPKLRSPWTKSVLDDILDETDLYKVLGVQRQSGDPDKQTLRRAYLSRSKSCHPE